MHNPLKSEAEVFRATVIVVTGAAAVIALALLAEPVYGAILAAALIGLGVGLAWRQSRGAEPRKAAIASGDGSAYRLLVVANQTVGGRALLDEIRNRAKGRRVETLVVTPALTRSAMQLYAGEIDEAMAEAERRREESVRTIAGLGIDVRGEVGDPDPNVAIEDALARFPADELIVSTHPPERSRWLEGGVVERARSEVDLPVTHVVVDLEAEAAAVPVSA
jgi:hypothetical protein